LSCAVVVAVGCSSGEKSGEKKEGDGKPKAQKRTVAESEVPKPILDGWASTYPGGKTSAWTERGGNYAARGVAGGHWVDVKFTKEGAVKESEEQLAADGAPTAVKTSFGASPYGKLKFVDSFKREAPDNKEFPTLYKFMLKDGEKPVIAVYRPDGSLVKEKTMPAEKFEKWVAEHTVAH
jgi:hypothetical protein